MPGLVVFRGREKQHTYQLDPGRYVVGRGQKADISLSSPLVSREHAVIAFEEGAWWLTDLKSPNGIYVNGSRVTRRRLSSGDRIELGPLVLLFDPSEGNVLEIETRRDLKEAWGGADLTAVVPPSQLEGLRQRTAAKLSTHLEVQEQDGRVREVPLVKRQHAVGFDDSCDIRLDGRRGLRRRVIELSRMGDGNYALVSLSSLLGVRVNGHRVSSRQLQDGDEITFKGYTLTYRAAIL